MKISSIKTIYRGNTEFHQVCVIYNCGTPKQKEEISAFIEDGVELPGVGDVLYDTSTPSPPWILILVARQDQIVGENFNVSELSAGELQIGIRLPGINLTF